MLRIGLAGPNQGLKTVALRVSQIKLCHLGDECKRVTHFQEHKSANYGTVGPVYSYINHPLV